MRHGNAVLAHLTIFLTLTLRHFLEAFSGLTLNDDFHEAHPDRVGISVG
jgi:hypothetical protein